MKLKKLGFLILGVLVAAGTCFFVSNKIKENEISEEAQNFKIMRIVEGLGNQMFQYAFSLVLERESNCKMLYDLSFYSEETQKYRKTAEQIATMGDSFKGANAKRSFSLCHFNIEVKEASPTQLNSCVRNYTQDDVTSKGLDAFNNSDLESFEGYYESTSLYDFNKYRELFIEKFSLKEPLNDENIEMMKKINETNSVALHFRRTDKVEENFYKDAYYDKAIEYIASNVKDPHFFIFSDDIEWVKKNVKLDFPFTIVDINDDERNYFDFELMKNCKHQIIANSTFSWWAAYLNENPHKVVTMPNLLERIRFKEWRMI